MRLREFGESVSDAVLNGIGRMYGRVQESRPLPADLLESDDAYLAVFDAPGVHPGDVQVAYEDGTLSVRIDRFREFYEEFEMLAPGRGLSLDGAVTLPADASVDPEAATARVTAHGTLEVHLPKREDDGSATGGRSASEFDEDDDPLEIDLDEE